MSTEPTADDARTADNQTTAAPRCDDCSAFVAADATTCANCDADLTAADDDAHDLELVVSPTFTLPRVKDDLCEDLPAHAFDWLAHDDFARRADERTLAAIAQTPSYEWHNDTALSHTDKQKRAIRAAARNPYATLEDVFADDADLPSPQYARDVLHRTFCYSIDRDIFGSH